MFSEAAASGDGGTTGAGEIVAIGAGDTFDDAELAQASKMSGEGSGRALGERRQEVGAAEASDVEGGTLQGRQQGLFGAAEEVETPDSAAFDGAGLGETVTLCMIPRLAFPHVNTPLLQTKDVKSLTIFAQFYLAISCLQQAAIEISQSVLDGGKRPAIVSVKWGDRVAERANFVAIF